MVLQDYATVGAPKTYKNQWFSMVLQDYAPFGAPKTYKNRWLPLVAQDYPSVLLKPIKRRGLATMGRRREFNTVGDVVYLCAPTLELFARPFCCVCCGRAGGSAVDSSRQGKT